MVCRFGGILLHADRLKHINNVTRILLQETELGQKVHVCSYSKRELEEIARILNFNDNFLLKNFLLHSISLKLLIVGKPRDSLRPLQELKISTDRYSCPIMYV